MKVLDEKKELSRPLFFKGGERACLLIHGFTGCTYEMMGLGEFLNKNDYTVSIVSLSGHGSVPEDLVGVYAEDWIDDVVSSYESLSREYSAVYPVGLSMGALLVIILASRFQNIPAGVLLSPALALKGRNRFLFPFLKYLPYSCYYTKPNGSNILDEEAKKRHIAYNTMPVKSIHEFYRVQKIAKRSLTEVKCPLLVIYSEKDGTVSEKSLKIIDRIITGKVEKLELQNSGHVLTVDREKDRVFNKVLEFLNKN
jgi:carboxylesterase